MPTWIGNNAFTEWIHESLTIVGVALLHEDLATVTTGVLVTEHGLPLVPAWIALFVGVVAGDVLIFACGAAARKIPWLRRRIIGPQVERVGQWLDSHLFRIVAVCKVTPGILFPTYVAYGWFGTSFPRFLTATVVAGVVYTTGALALMTLVGQTLFHQLGYWVWIVAAVAILVLTSVAAGRPNRWRRIVLNAAPGRPHVAERLRRFRILPSLEHRGMPSLRELRQRVASAERIAPAFFYIPLGVQWLLLGIRHRSLTLPTAANPRIEGGGFWGESKSSVLRQIGPNQQLWVAPFVTVDRSCDDPGGTRDVAAALHAMQAAGLDFPVVAKPDIGWQGLGVRVVDDPVGLLDYLTRYPVGERLILQRLVPYDGEAAVFYVRKPGEPHGQVRSMTLRYFPHVVGDGQRTLRDLIVNDPRAGWKSDFYLGVQSNHTGLTADELEEVPPEGSVVRLTFIGSQRVGGLYRDGTRDVTPALQARFDEIALTMPEFHYGRFDIRFDAIDALREGKDFFIFEVNGAGAEDIHVWDPNYSVAETYRSLFRTQAMLFKIGAMNRKRGFKPATPMEFIRLFRKQRSLDGRYPPSS